MRFEGTVNMTSRRDLLNLAVRGSALTAAATLMPASSSAAPTAGTRDEGRAAARQRYYDMAPWYGLGLAERRFGYFLHNKKRSEFVLSSKVGKLLKASKTARNRD